MTDTPQVAVLMSVHNGARYLREAVESILAQTYADFEFIVVDDGSTDASASILGEYAARDARIVLLDNGENVGLARSLNRGLAIARGTYVARMDADDISLPSRLAAQVDFMHAHPDVGVLGTAYQVIDRAGAPHQTVSYPEEPGALRWSLCFRDPIAHPTVMMRSEVVRRAGGYDEDLATTQDYDLWCRLSRWTRIANLAEVLLLYRTHEASVTATRSDEQHINSIRASRLMISQVLGEDVSVETVHGLWDPERATAEDLRRAIELVHQLYEVVIADPGLSGTEKVTIGQDAMGRLLAVACEKAALCDARYAAALMYQVCQELCADRALSALQKRSIRARAADKLSVLAIARIRDMRVWPLFARAWVLDPLVVARGARWVVRWVKGRQRDRE